MMMRQRFFLLCLSILTSSTWSFVIGGFPNRNPSLSVVLAANPTDEQPVSGDEPPIVETAGETEVPVAAESEEKAGEEEEVEVEPEEDPEVIAVKAEIGALEAELKILRGTLSHTEEAAEEYSKTGYARKVAEMENVRRARKTVQTTNKSAATAEILSEFIPILDRLMELRDTYAEDEFGKQYGALPTALQNALVQLEVTEFFVAAGDVVDKTRMTVTGTVHSETAPADTVVEATMPGLELQGNIVRPALCVASLGSEKVAESDSDEIEAVEEPET